MRSGLTTGTCATGAAKAAALLLAGQDAVSAVEVALPGGALVSLEGVSAALVGEGVARAAVVKDAGDDADVTDGITIVVTVELGGEGVRFAAGEGVGVVTKSGLQLEPGEPAINPVPREMIRAALAEVLGDRVDALVTVGALGGSELAAKTFNRRLGIEGGISIIGTTGRVEPKSTEAWMRSLLPQVDVAVSAGHRTVWLAPGGIGERFAIEELGAPAEAVVICSNFVGDLLDACARAGVERVVLVGHAGKLVKVAAGVFDTHNRAGDARLETVAAVAAAEGAAGPLVARLLELPTVQAAIAELERADLAHVWDAVARRASRRSSERAGLPVDVVLLGYGGEVLGATGRASQPTDGLVIVGVGPGAEDLLTAAAWREIRRAEVVAGGTRLLDVFAPEGVERIVIGADVASALADVARAIDAGRRVVALSSGDPAFFGLLASVRRFAPQLAVRVVPGISSATTALARLGMSWEGVAVASVHGREPEEALATCATHERTLVLVDRSVSPQVFSAALSELGRFEVTVLERLGYPEERITTGPAGVIAAGHFDALSVLLVRSL